MSKHFTFTVDDTVGDEIEQYIYGKYGTASSKSIGSMVMSVMSKNPITVQQYNRIVRKYGDSTVIALEPLSGTAKADLNT